MKYEGCRSGEKESGEAASFPVVDRRLYDELHNAFLRVAGKDGKKRWVSKVKSGTIFRIVPYPDVLNRIIPWKRDVIVRAAVVRKLLNKHRFTLHDVARLPQALRNPVAVFEDQKSVRGFIVVTDIKTLNDRGEMKKSLAALELKSDGENAYIAHVTTSYSPNGTGKYRGLFDAKALRYVDKEKARDWAKEEGSAIFQLLTTSLAAPGSGVMLKENMLDVNYNFADNGKK